MSTIQGFTRAQLERALDEAGSAGDTIGAAALQIALGQTVNAELSAAEIERATAAAADLQSWVSA